MPFQYWMFILYMCIYIYIYIPAIQMKNEIILCKVTCIIFMLKYDIIIFLFYSNSPILLNVGLVFHCTGVL